MTKDKLPARCCGRCIHGRQRELPAPKSPQYSAAVTFNRYSRVCSRIEGGRVYPAWEKNRCRQFEEANHDML